MKIAICDNDTVFSNKLKHILYNYSNKRNLEIYVETFESGEKLLLSQSKYLLIFIEYSLPGINGLETVENLRKQNNNTKIIFITHHTQFIFDAFKVNTYRFLTKPIAEKSVHIILDDLFFTTNKHYPLWISDGYNTHCIDTSEIVYLEADNKYCFVHLKNDVILCKKTMARVFSALPKTYFQKINRSFIVNLKYINKYNTDSVFLKNGEGLHITRSHYKNFKENYIDYSNPTII